MRSKRIVKKSISLILAFTLGITSFLGLLAENFRLIDYLGLKSLITAYADNPDLYFYKDGELIGVNKDDYTDANSIYYKIGDNGDWNEYSHPFAIPAYTPTAVYAKLGENGTPIGETFTSSKLAIGKYNENITDFTISYNNVDFGYSRTYDYDNHDWFFSINSECKSVNKRYEVTLPDGTKMPFVRRTQNEYINELTGTKLTVNGINKVVDMGDYKIGYNSTDITYTEDKYGNRISFSYRPENYKLALMINDNYKYYIEDIYEVGVSGEFTPTTDDFSNTDQFYYNVITDPKNGTIQYIYNTDYELIKILDQTDSFVSRYKYDSNGRIIKSLDKTISYNSDNRVSRIDYDSGDYLVYNYDDENKTYSVTNAIGQTATTVYNDAFLPTQYTDENGDTTTYTYNDDFKLTSESSDGITTTYSYNNNGDLVSSSSDGEVTTNSYDSNNRLIRTYDGESYTYYDYNTNNDVTVVATLKEDYNGDIPQSYDSSLTCFDNIEYSYDNNGRISTVYDHKNDEYESYQYDTYGNQTNAVKKKISDNSTISTTVNTYDAVGNLLTSVTNNNDSTEYVYDEAGRVLRQNNNGKVTRTFYDELGRVVREIEPEVYDSQFDGLPESNTYTDTAHNHTYEYNNNNQLTSEINRFGVTTLYTYHTNGVLESKGFLGYGCDYNNKGQITRITTDDTGNYCRFYYDDNDRLIKKKYPRQAGGYCHINYYYDSNNNVIAQKFKDGTAAEVTQFEYTYDENNNLLTKKDYTNNQFTQYDNNGNVTVYNIVEENGQSVNQFAYSYNHTEKSVDELTNEVTPERDSYTYANNKTLNVTYSDDDALYSLNNNDSFTLSSNENENGDTITEYTSPYESDILKYTYQYDNNGNVTNNSINQYDNKNRITSTTYNGNSVDYSYNSNGFIYQSFHSFNSKKFTYSYTAINTFFNTSIRGIAEYEIDNHDNSSLLSMENFNYKYYDSDILTSYNGQTVLTDKVGNIRSIGSRELTWTNLNQLRSITDGDDSYSYTYDENGIRTSKTVNGTKTNFFTVDGRIISQNDGTNTWCFQYDEGDDIIGFLYNDAQYYYITNQMGDVIGIINSDGEYIANYIYDDWGKIVNVDKPSGNTTLENTIADTNPMLYRGYYYDYESGYYYLQSRYYSPELTRFISADDIDAMFDVKDSAYGGANGYSYCCNDPVNNIDRNGKNIKSLNKLILHKYVGAKMPKNFGKQSISENGFNMLKACESFHSKAYKALSSEKYYTYGYGHYGIDVKASSTITKKNADILLRKDIKIHEKNLNKFIIRKRIYLNQKQFDACIIDSYQRGENMWTKKYWKKYDLPCMLDEYRVFNDKNIPKFKIIKSAFLGTLGVSDGRKKRRIAEARLFSGGFYCTRSSQIYD